jgi:3-oxoacyl-[acyl-carrier-protein] synthase II
MSRRVVLTGAGAVSSIGIGVDEFWRNCLQGKSAVAPIPERWLRYSEPHSRIWAPLPKYDPEAFGITRIERLQLDPVSMLAIGAAREAIERAGFGIIPGEGRSRNFVLSGADAARTGVYFGTGIGGAQTFLHSHAYHTHQRANATLKTYAERCTIPGDRETLENVLALIAPGPRYNPFVVPMLMPNAPSAAVGIKFSLTGPNATFCVACASGTVAIGNAYRAVRDNYVDVAIAGGSEYLYDEHGHIFRIFDVPGTLVRDCANPETANRPFDEKRSGFLFGEGGAAVLVLEELEHAQRRGATIMAELIGYSETFDAHSMMSLAPGGMQIERMIRGVLADADLEPQDVDYINAHGTSTKNNDQTEAEVINRVFGKSVRINSTKSLLGHTIGASGAFEALVTALTLRDGKTHVCKNLDQPLLDLNFVRTIEPFEPRVALSQSFAFGGHNAAIAFRKYDLQ